MNTTKISPVKFITTVSTLILMVAFLWYFACQIEFQNDATDHIVNVELVE